MFKLFAFNSSFLLNMTALQFNIFVQGTLAMSAQEVQINGCYLN